MFEKFINSSLKEKGLLEVGEVKKKEFIERVSFEFKAGLPFIEVEIADESYTFLFDTAALSVVPNSLVSKLSLEVIQEITISDSKGEHSNRTLYTLPSLKVATLEFCDFVVVTQDFCDSTTLSCLGFDGILGYNFLHSLIVKLDYENREIVLSDRALSTRGYTKTALYFDGYSGAKFEVNFPFRNVLFTLDTGKNDGISLAKEDEFNAFSEYGYEYKETSGLFMSSFSGVEEHLEERSYLVKEFSITKAIKINMYPVSLSNRTQNLIGNDFLKNFEIIIDFQKKLLFLRHLSSGVIEKKLSESFGFFTHWSEEKRLYISALTKESPASEKGLHVGERILAIDGHDMYDMSREEYCEFFLKSHTGSDNYETHRSVELTIKNDKTIKRVVLKKQDI